MPKNSLWMLQQADGQVVPVGRRPIRIGRGPGNDIALPDAQVSRLHAAVWTDEGSAYVRDEGSTNGTFCNGAPVTGHRTLQAGDRLRIGTAEFVVLGPTQGAARPSRGTPVGILAGAAALLLLIVVIVALRKGTDRPTTVTGTLSSPASVVPEPASTVVPTLSEGEATQQALDAAVRISIMDEAQDVQSSGSGSIVDANGLILTNYHVIEDAELHPGWWAEISIDQDEASPPVPTFRGEIVLTDRDLDLAVLRVRALDGSPLMAPPSLPAVPLGDSDQVQIGDDLTIIGFPSVGGDTVTLTRGTVAGFHDDGVRPRAWIKTDTEISPGNSGGMAVTRAGALVGIPTWVSAEDSTLGRLGVLRPSNLARDLVSQAQRELLP